jgi:hypothetical protein
MLGERGESLLGMTSWVEASQQGGGAASHCEELKFIQGPDAWGEEFELPCESEEGAAPRERPYWT